MEEDSDFVPTRISSLRANAHIQHQTITYHTHQAKSKNVPVSETNSITTNKSGITKKTPEEFDMKQARHEIIKFGMNAYEPKDQDEAKIQLAIRLGAKPPKRQYRNYKEILAEKKLENLKRKATIDFDQLGKNSKGMSTSKNKKFSIKRRKEKGDIINIYGTPSAKMTRGQLKKMKNQKNNDKD